MNSQAAAIILDVIAVNTSTTVTGLHDNFNPVPGHIPFQPCRSNPPGSRLRLPGPGHGTPDSTGRAARKAPAAVGLGTVAVPRLRRRLTGRPEPEPPAAALSSH